MLKIVVTNRNSHESIQLSLSSSVISIGRLKDNAVCLDSKAVSRRHARLDWNTKHWSLVDLDSGNGTYLNGKRVPSGERQLLRANDRIRIEEFEISFEDFPQSEPQSPEELADREVSSRADVVAVEDSLWNQGEVTDAGLAEIKVLKKVLTALDSGTQAFVEVREGPRQGEKLSMHPEASPVVIGRDTGAHWVFRSPDISRKHAQFVFQDGQWWIHDLGSKNGTRCQSQFVGRRALVDKDVLELGPLVLVFHHPQPVDYAALAEQWKQKESASTADASSSKSDEPGLEAQGDQETSGVNPSIESQQESDPLAQKMEDSAGGLPWKKKSEDQPQKESDVDRSQSPDLEDLVNDGVAKDDIGSNSKPVRRKFAWPQSLNFQPGEWMVLVFCLAVLAVALWILLDLFL